MNEKTVRVAYYGEKNGKWMVKDVMNRWYTTNREEMGAQLEAMDIQPGDDLKLGIEEKEWTGRDGKQITFMNIVAAEKEIQQEVEPGVTDAQRGAAIVPTVTTAESRDVLIIRQVTWKAAAKSSSQLAAAGIKAGLFTTIEQAQEWRNGDSAAYAHSLEEDILR